MNSEIPENVGDRFSLRGRGTIIILSVILQIILFLVIVGLSIYIMQRKPKRVDTTVGGSYSLKPQTLNIISKNSQKITITSLYTRAKRSDVDNSEAKHAADVEEAQRVQDLLEEYHSKGKNIEVEALDPVESSTKVDALIAEVTEKYGGEVNKYKKFIDERPKRYKEITDSADAESKLVVEIFKTTSQNPRDPSVAFFRQVYSVLKGVPDDFAIGKEIEDKLLSSKPPNYKAVIDAIKRQGGELSVKYTSIIKTMVEYKDDPRLPEPIRKYATDSLARYEKMKLAVDALSKDSENLGELKLDAIRESLAQENPILIRGEKEFKILEYSKVWRKDNQSASDEAVKIKKRFAGEQLISGAIRSLQNGDKKKLKVAIVRPGGGPLADPGMPFFRPEGPFAAVADRLREYNFEVLEKDLSGQWAMQQMQQGQMAAPEPTDEEIKDAVWVVLDLPSPQRNQFQPPQTITPKVMEHINGGGSAIIVSQQNADNMSGLLNDWGIKLRTESLIVHERVKAEGTDSDFIETIKKNPVFFEIRDWGNAGTGKQHAVTSAIGSLPGIFFAGSPVSVTPTKGIKATSILPIPGGNESIKAWGETNLESTQKSPKFDPATDIDGPVFGGVIAEKENAGRLIVIGSLQMFISDVVNYPDQASRQKGEMVIRFPGNGELFTNCIYWLHKQDEMIAISPASTEVSRINPMTSGTQRFWRVFVLLVGLPLLVVIFGVFVFLSRQD